MKLLMLVIAGAMLNGFAICILGAQTNDPPRPKWQPVERSVETREQLDEALKKRWPPEMIRGLCNSTPPTPGSFQNLVALGPKWEGDMYAGEKTGFDRIWWYATLKDGKLDEYSLNATKGKKNWIVEMGTQRTLARPPITRDVKTPGRGTGVKH